MVSLASTAMLLDEVDLPLVCGCVDLAAVFLETLSQSAPLGPMSGALAVLAQLARHVARRSTTSVG